MATLATNVSFQCFDSDGKPLAGGKVYTYSAGTTTSKATYTTMAGTVANPNPVILDQNGKAKIFLSDGSYRLQIKDSNDALIDDIDQISRYVTQSEFATFQQTVNDGVSQLTEVREQIDVFVNTSIGNQKGFANGITPLDANVKVDPIYLPDLPNNAIPQATETALGVAKIATTAIARAGTNNTDFITALKLANTRQSVWVNKTGMLFGTTYMNTALYEKEISFLSEIVAGFLLTAKVTFKNLTTNIETIVYFGCASNWTGGIASSANFTVPPNTSFKIGIVRTDSLSTVVTLTVSQWSERYYV